MPLSADTGILEKSTINLVTGPDYPPYAADYLPYDGLAPFLAFRILESGNRSVTVDLLPWKRGYRDTLNGRYDAILPYVESPARLDDYLFSVSIFDINTFAYVDADSDIYVQSLEGLEGLTYCNPVGFSDSWVLKQLRSNGRITRVTPGNMKNCFKMLHAGRVDFVKTNHQVADYILAQLELSAELFRRLPFVVEHTSLHLMVPRTRSGAEELIQEFNTLLNEMARSGELEALKENYLEQVKPKTQQTGATNE